MSINLLDERRSSTVIDGQRLRDIADLPLDLAI